MTKAVFLDFYGTVVHEDGEIIREITGIIASGGTGGSPAEIGRYWWGRFQSLCAGAHGETFETQRSLELRSLEDTLEHFGSRAGAGELCAKMFDYWVRPEIFEDSKAFFERCPVPVYIVSNIDSRDIRLALRHHGLAPAGVFTSEDARAYKPRTELFRLALDGAGLGAEEVLHVGDSVSGDVEGAARAGIRALWLNRSHREAPEGVRSVSNLLDVLNYL